MSKFCTECGTKIDENYKFCPDCGANIVTYHPNNHSEVNQYEADDLSSEKEISLIVCDNCGEENSSANKICDGCGVKLKGAVSSKPIERKKVQTTKKEIVRSGKSYPKQKNNAAKRKVKTQRKTTIAKEEKVIDSKKIYLIVAVIGIFTIVVLVSSGVFDSNVTTQNIDSSTNQSSGSGINLNNIQLINNLEAELNANPDDTKTLLKLADLNNDSGFYEKAIPLYKRYLKKIPSDADARIDMGVCFYNIGNYDASIKEMKTALEHESNHQIGHLNLGVVNLTAGNVDVAKEWFQKAIELGPDTEVGKKAKNLLNSHNFQ
ncbi:MAG: zinc ribbon domain-containing protein [Ignavibacteria bacterium]|nr:zinc ribbon domain-containing protein [Ignavibacteria bacterium]